MHVFVTGATGLIGKRLVLDRLERGDRVTVVSRDGGRASRLFAAEANPNIRVVEGDPVSPGPWQQAVAGCDAVVNLAGAGIADRRWSHDYKRTLAESRIGTTRQLVRAIEAANPRPTILLSGSAVGIYGETGDEERDESSTSATVGDFLADLCRQWETEALAAKALGVRVVLMRTGVVLDERSPALRRMMLPLRWYVGGPIGSGRQFMSWIHHRDLVGLIDFALRRDIEGPVNLTSPQPARNREFIGAFARAMGRPCWLPVPRLAVRLALGEVASSLIASQRILPRKAMDIGYQFLYSDIKDAAATVVDEIRRAAGRAPQRRFGLHETVDSPRVTSLDPGASKSMAASSSPAPAGGKTKRARPERRIRLLAIDVDGTLLSNNGWIAQGVIDACRAAARAGCTIVPATARPPRSMRAIVQTLGTDGPTINYNGAVIWDTIENRAQFHEALDHTLASEIVAEARAILPEVIVSVELLDRWFTDRVDSRFHTETSRVFDPDYVGALDTFLDKPITKLMLLEDPTRLSPVLDLVRDRYWSQRQVAVFLTDPYLIQIVHPTVDKAVALQRIADRMGIARDEVMAIGDGPNDAGMIEWAGFGVAMENACETVRGLADAMVPSNDDLGVAKAIQRYVLG